MADFEQKAAEFQSAGLNLIAGSVDARQGALKTVNDLGISFPVAHDLDLQDTLRNLGGFYHQKKGYLQPAGFLIRPGGQVELAVYSSGPIGRLQAQNVLSLVRYYKQNRD